MAPYYFLENEDWAIDGVEGRCFFQFPFDFEKASTEKHVSFIHDLEDVDIRNHPEGWILTFKYRNHCFTIDNHYHGTASSFIVADSTCPDEILIQILGMFVNPMKIASNGLEPTHSELITVENRSFLHRLFRWLRIGG